MFQIERSDLRRKGVTLYLYDNLHWSWTSVGFATENFSLVVGLRRFVLNLDTTRDHGFESLFLTAGKPFAAATHCPKCGARRMGELTTPCVGLKVFWYKTWLPYRGKKKVSPALSSILSEARTP
jgi:hypothetical protein